MSDIANLDDQRVEPPTIRGAICTLESVLSGGGVDHPDTYIVQAAIDLLEAADKVRARS